MAAAQTGKPTHIKKPVIPMTLSKTCSLLKKTLAPGAAALLILAACALPARCADWPMFRGSLTHAAATADNVAPPLSLHWSFQAGKEIVSSPSVAAGVVYVGARDNKLYALNASTGAKLWEFQTGGWVDSSPAVAGAAVYFTSRDGFLYALDKASGALVWKYETGGTDISSPAVSGGVIYFGSGYPNKSVFAINSNGTLKWKVDTQQMVYSSPAVANGIVYVGSNDGTYYALNATTGAEVWAAPTAGGIYFSSPAISGATVFAAPGDYDPNVYAWNAANGSKIWETEIPSAGRTFVSSPAVGAGRVVLGSGYPAQSLYALDANTGSILWDTPLGDASAIGYTSSPTLTATHAFVGSGGGTLYAVALANGQIDWEFVTGGPIISSPTVSGGKLFAASGDGMLYAFW
jgi:outer membrane protein assembly factor BamB